MKRVVCLGSYQGADQLGWLLADALDAVRSTDPVAAAAFEVRRCASPAQMPSLVTGAEAVLILDAAPQLDAGKVQRIEPDMLVRDAAWSSHGLDLVTVLEIIRTLGDMPSRFVILGIGVGTASADAEAIAAHALPAVLSQIVAL